MNDVIEKGDWFTPITPHALVYLKVTKSKHYLCVCKGDAGDDTKVFFIDDDGKEDWHYPSQFKKIAPPAHQLPLMPDCKSAWQSYDPQQENYECKEPEPENPSNQPTQTITRDFLVSGSTKSTTMLPANKEARNCVIELPYTPYHETTVISIYGRNVNEMSEEQIYHELTNITVQQERLKEMNKEAKSSRILGQINALGQARNKIVKYLDELPDSPKTAVKTKK